jgi:hypothetical protein
LRVVIAGCVEVWECWPDAITREPPTLTLGSEDTTARTDPAGTTGTVTTTAPLETAWKAASGRTGTATAGEVEKSACEAPETATAALETTTGLSATWP